MFVSDQRGRRVVVVGAASDPSTLRGLIDAGAEVHSIDVRKPEVAWLASHTDCELSDAAALVAAIERIGAMLHAVYLVSPLSDEPRRSLIGAARSKSVEGNIDVIEVIDGDPPT